MAIKETLHTGFLNGLFLGVRIWIWFYFVFSILMGAVVAIYFFRERIRFRYYSLRYPEKLIKVIIHYPSNMFKIYWRLIPEDNFINAEKKLYHFTEKHLQKSNTTFARTEIDKSITETMFEIDGTEYKYKELALQRKRFISFPEIHYFMNNPNPIVFDLRSKKIDLTSKQLEEFKENDLFTKLLTMDAQKSMLMFILILGIINLLASVFIISKLMGWVK